MEGFLLRSLSVVAVNSPFLGPRPHRAFKFAALGWRFDRLVRLAPEEDWVGESELVGLQNSLPRLRWLCLILFDFAGHLAKSVPASLVRIRLSSSKLGRILAAVSRSLGTAATSVTRRLLSIDRKT